MNWDSQTAASLVKQRRGALFGGAVLAAALMLGVFGAWPGAGASPIKSVWLG